MALYRLILRLARNPGYPEGDRSQGYVIVAPLDADDRLDVDEWRQHRNACTIVRFAPGLDRDADGWLTHRADHWMFHYDEASEGADEPVFRLSQHRLALGDYVTVQDSDDQERVYRVDERSLYRVPSPPSHKRESAS